MSAQQTIQAESAKIINPKQFQTVQALTAHNSYDAASCAEGKLKELQTLHMRLHFILEHMGKAPVYTETRENIRLYFSLSAINRDFNRVLERQS